MPITRRWQRDLDQGNDRKGADSSRHCSLYQIVTGRIIEALEHGTVPWRKPWTGGSPRNVVSQKEYRGLNVFLLASAPFASPFWLTFAQAKQLGGSVRKGEKGYPVIFWSFPAEITDDLATKDTGRAPIVRYYTVFNVEQCDGIDEPRHANRKLSDAERIAAAERLVLEMPQRPAFAIGNAAWYRPSTDTVGMPPFESFDNAERYYSTLLHELIHATGHESRLNREGTGGTIRFGSDPYAKEELVAEMGAAMLCGAVGIENATLDQSAAYVASWLTKLRNDHRLVILAAAQAQKAADFVRGTIVQGAPQ